MVVGLDISSYKIATGQGNNWDKVDLTVNGIGLGMTTLGSHTGASLAQRNLCLLWQPEFSTRRDENEIPIIHSQAFMLISLIP